MKFKQAISVLESEIILLKNQSTKGMCDLDQMIYRIRIEGLKRAIGCLKKEARK